MLKVNAQADTQDPGTLLVVVEIHANNPEHVPQLQTIAKRWRTIHVDKQVMLSPPDVLRVELRL
jgi:hypothetical protein